MWTVSTSVTLSILHLMSVFTVYHMTLSVLNVIENYKKYFKIKQDFVMVSCGVMSIHVLTKLDNNPKS